MPAEEQVVEQQELFTDRYLKLIEAHQKLQLNLSRVWAENERLKLEQGEWEGALVMVMRRFGLTEVLISPAELKDCRDGYELVKSRLDLRSLHLKLKRK